MFQSRKMKLAPVAMTNSAICFPKDIKLVIHDNIQMNIRYNLNLFLSTSVSDTFQFINIRFIFYGG